MAAKVAELLINLRLELFDIDPTLIKLTVELYGLNMNGSLNFCEDYMNCYRCMTFVIN